eukprot:CAMPEP_0197048490 /NCGR_PEP_ID=MMETSP1384-20130603/23829_1 /TAXON_ID=29189 /ORGANISM="Ammonia sp." /LENGTH=241 /DNA_ID=CAMNT_0042480633 /DNA_START=61 /DNA_END=786 /DNA_ORIENTATION=+
MNYPKFELGPLMVCTDHIKPVLQCLIHTIMFHRTLGVVNPREIASDLFSNITYMSCHNNNVYNEIEEKIQVIMQAINKQIIHEQHHSLMIGANNTLIGNVKEQSKSEQKESSHIDIDRILVLFYESKQKEHWFGIGQSESKQYWERWDIKLNIIKSKKDVDLYKLEKSIKANIIKIIECVNANYNHLPKLPKEKELSSPVCYPYEITIPNKNSLDDGYTAQVLRGFKSTIKKFVENAPQTN